MPHVQAPFGQDEFTFGKNSYLVYDHVMTKFWKKWCCSPNVFFKENSLPI